MKYKLFIADYDGTLGDWDGIDEETVETIKKYERAGGKFAICTGRMFHNIRQYCNRYGIADLIASYQGAMINERKSGKELFADKIPDDLAIEVLKFVKPLPVQPAVLAEDALYYEHDSDYIGFYKKVKIVELKRVEDLAECIAKKQFSALKINVSCEGIKPEDFVREYRSAFSGRLVLNSGSNIIAEFINPTCSKGAAVRFLANYYGVRYDEIIAVGDSTNDIELIGGKWHGVAVGDGAEELKAIADEITVPFSEKPVKHLLEKYCL